MEQKKPLQFSLSHVLLVVAVVGCVSAWLRWSVYGGTDIGVLANGLERVEELDAAYCSNIKMVWLRECDRERVTPNVKAYDDAYVISRLDKMEQFENLDELYLSGSPITTKSVEKICELKNIRKLLLNDTPLDDSVVPVLCEATHMRCLYLHGTRISKDGIAKIQAALPNCEFP